MPGRLNNYGQIILVAIDIRSAHNIGSLFRTAEGLGVDQLLLAGYSPYPRKKDDSRLEHVIARADSQIAKTALGSQTTINWQHIDNLEAEVNKLKALGYQIFGLEQDSKSKVITDFKSPDKMVLIIGNEVAGLDRSVLGLCDQIVEIPMLGKKESFNVVQAAAMALFYFRFIG